MFLPPLPSHTLKPGAAAPFDSPTMYTLLSNRGYIISNISTLAGFQMNGVNNVSPIRIPINRILSLVPSQGPNTFLATSQGQSYTIPSISFLNTDTSNQAVPNSVMLPSIANCVYNTQINVNTMNSSTQHGVVTFNAGSQLFVTSMLINSQNNITAELGGLVKDGSTGMMIGNLTIGSVATLKLVGYVYTWAVLDVLLNVSYDISLSIFIRDFTDTC
jgi:hypothetical protein